MIGDGGFKAHGAGLGPKLGASLASGSPGLMRRVEEARERDRAAELARRLKAGAVADITPEQGVAEPGTDRDGADVKCVGPVSAGKGSGPRGGRPRVVEGEPWKAEGVSRRTWERRRKAGGG